jgi:uncharacterized membrane protein YkvA (DUF1232 family)
MWIAAGASIVVAIALVWVVLIAVLYATRPDGTTLADTARLIPDTFRLVRKLATDRTIPLRTRLPVWLLLAYLSSPIDLVPDFVPVIGYADDAIIASLVLRRLIRKAGVEKLADNWPGTPDGLDRLTRLLRMTTTLTAAESEARLLRRGLRLEYATLGWNVVGVVVTLAAAVMAQSVALAGFSLDSGVEIFASLVVVGELAGTATDVSQQRAERRIGYAFLALCVYLGGQAVVSIVADVHPYASPVGIGWLAATAVAMFALASGKAVAGRALDHRVLRAEAKVTFADGALATATLVGLILNAAAGWWWADVAAGIVIVGYGLREGLHLVGN